MNPPNLLLDKDLRTAAPSLDLAIRRQSTDAEIPFLIAKIPFRSIARRLVRCLVASSEHCPFAARGYAMSWVVRRFPPPFAAADG